MQGDDEFLEFSDITDVIASVDLIAMLAGPAKENPLLWKWIVLAAHSGIQGAMACNLGGTSALGGLDEKSRKGMLGYMELDDPDGAVPPKQRLATFDTLLKWIQDPKRVTDGTTWKISKAQRKTLNFLTYLRNEFTHFKINGWSIGKGGMPETVGVALEGIETLMLGSPRVRRHMEDGQLETFRKTLAQARAAFQ